MTAHDNNLVKAALAALAARFHDLFAGSERAHFVAVQQAAAVPGEKSKPKYRTDDSGGATPELWQRHLAGKRSLGVIPYMEGSTCRWGAIDVDTYDGSVTAADLVADVDRLKLPLVACMSKSGGVHLLLFLKEPAPAADVVAALDSMRLRLGIEKPFDLRPLKDSAPPGKFGTGLNMPYFGGDESDRHGVALGGRWLSPAEFLDVAEAAQVTAAELAALTQPVTDANPRGRTAPARGPVGKGHLTPDEARKRLQTACSRLAEAPPGGADNTLNGVLFDAGKLARDAGLDRDEVMDVVLSAWMERGKTYSDFKKHWPSAFDDGMKSDEPPRHGDDEEKQYPHIESIVRVVGGEEVTLEIKLAGHERILEMPARLLARYANFIDACVSQLSTSFHLMKHDAWTSTYLPALQAATTRRLAEDETIEGEFFRHLEDFCTGRYVGQDREALLTGHPWYDDEESRKVFFVFSDLRKFIDRAGESRIKGSSSQKMGKLLNNVGRGEPGGDVGKTTIGIKGKKVEVRWVLMSLFQDVRPLSLPPLSPDVV